MFIADWQRQRVGASQGHQGRSHHSPIRPICSNAFRSTETWRGRNHAGPSYPDYRSDQPNPSPFMGPRAPDCRRPTLFAWASTRSTTRSTIRTKTRATANPHRRSTADAPARSIAEDRSSTDRRADAIRSAGVVRVTRGQEQGDSAILGPLDWGVSPPCQSPPRRRTTEKETKHVF